MQLQTVVAENTIQLGNSSVPQNNLTIKSNVNGTFTFARGNVGTTTQDLLTIDSVGMVSLPVSTPYSMATPKIMVDSVNTATVTTATTKITKGIKSLISWGSWLVGTGSVVGYSVNGDATENCRSLQTDPWGNKSMVWGTFPSGSNADDGGWNGAQVLIDHKKLYRYSIWVRRTSVTTGGTAYFGMQTSTGNVLALPSLTSEGNPYFDNRGISGLIKDQWYLFTAHVFPSDSTTTTPHANSGYYYPNNTTKIGSNAGNVPNDCRFVTGTTTASLRAYHYYCADSTSRLEFFQPRIDLVDGAEPSISDIVNNTYVANDNMTWIDESDQVLDITKIAGNAARYTRLLYTQVDSGSYSFTTTWVAGPVFPITQGFKAGSLIKLFYHIPMRNDSTSWGGAYVEPQININGTGWQSLGSTGFGAAVMMYGYSAIRTYNNSLTIDPAQTSDFSAQFRFYFMSYDGTTGINNTSGYLHDINVVSGTAAIMSGNNGLQHHTHLVVEELAIFRGAA